MFFCFFFQMSLLVQPSKAKRQNPTRITLLFHFSVFTFQFSLHHLHAAHLTWSHLPSFAPFKFHPFNLPPSLFFSLHCLDSSQAQPHSFTFGLDVLTGSHSLLHAAFTFSGSLFTLTASRRLTRSEVQRISGSDAQCCEHDWLCYLGLENLGSLYLALVGCEHGFSCDMGLETMAGLCYLVTLVLFSCDCCADWDLGTGVVGWARVHGFVPCNPVHNWVMSGLQVLTRLIIGSGSC
jgi:hypothetical protein